MTWLLNSIYLVLLLCATPWLLWRRVTQGRYRRGWSKKFFGKLPEIGKSPTEEGQGGKTLWFHAVSVGELQVIRPLVERAERQMPEARLLITTSTDAGYELALKLYSKHVVSYAPMDFSWAISRALARTQPDMIILAELELWPNWISLAARRGIPVVVINGRLSQRSLEGYKRLGGFVTSVVRKLAWVGAQSATYRERFLELGLSQDRVDVTGNIKFDGANFDREAVQVQQRALELHLDRASIDIASSDSNSGRPIVWLCGSTQAPEEQLCLDTFQKLAGSYPHLKLILVPRHPERFEEVARLIEQTGLPWLRRSAMAAGRQQTGKQPIGEGVDPSWRIFLADSVGELRWWWGLADLGFVGGSFGSRGGQNMIEPCAVRVATCFGPNTKNFRDVVQILLESQGAMELSTPEELGPWVIRMIENPDIREEYASRGQGTALAHRGATERTWQKLAQLLRR
ncbi:MAG: 3-deoxy-D-manno-octulosonic acid transferase [Planctomycetota bacterium]